MMLFNIVLTMISYTASHKVFKVDQVEEGRAMTRRALKDGVKHLAYLIRKRKIKFVSAGCKTVTHVGDRSLYKDVPDLLFRGVVRSELADILLTGESGVRSENQYVACAAEHLRSPQDSWFSMTSDAEEAMRYAAVPPFRGIVTGQERVVVAFMPGEVMLHQRLNAMLCPVTYAMDTLRQAEQVSADEMQRYECTRKLAENTNEHDFLRLPGITTATKGDILGRVVVSSNIDAAINAGLFGQQLKGRVKIYDHFCDYFKFTINAFTPYDDEESKKANIQAQERGLIPEGQRLISIDEASNINVLAALREVASETCLGKAGIVQHMSVPDSIRQGDIASLINAMVEKQLDAQEQIKKSIEMDLDPALLNAVFRKF